MARVVSVVLLFLLCAGCLGRGDDPASTEVNEVASPPPRVQAWEGFVTAAGGCPGDVMGPVLVGSFTAPEEIVVLGNVTTLLVELQWEPTFLPACLHLTDPLARPYAITSDVTAPGTGNLRFSMDTPATGVWRAVVYSQGASHIEFRAASTVFYGEVPADYTAFA